MATSRVTSTNCERDGDVALLMLTQIISQWHFVSGRRACYHALAVPCETGRAAENGQLSH